MTELFAGPLYIVRLTEITVQITSGVSTLIRQHIALTDNFSLRFTEFCFFVLFFFFFFFSDFLI